MQMSSFSFKVMLSEGTKLHDSETCAVVIHSMMTNTPIFGKGMGRGRLMPSLLSFCYGGIMFQFRFVEYSQPLKQVMTICLFIFDNYILVFLLGIQVIGETEVDIVMAEVLP